MKPGLADLRVDALLSNFSIAYRNTKYINDLILPRMTVKYKTGRYAKYGLENFRTNMGNLYRAPGTRAVSADFTVSMGDYSCKERCIEKPVPWEYIKNQQDPFNIKRDATQYIMDMVIVNREKALRDFMASTVNLPQNITLTGTDQWNDYANSDPFDDIDTAINTVFDARGIRPNTLILSYDVFVKLKKHPDTRENIRYTNGGQLSDTDFANGLKQYFNLDNVLIGTAHGDNTVEGQTASLSAIWTKDAWVVYIPPTAGLMVPAFGMTFEDEANIVDEYVEESHKRDVVRVTMSYDQNICDNYLAYYIKNAIA